MSKKKPPGEENCCTKNSDSTSFCNCEEKQAVFTRKELKILEEIRLLQKRARQLKSMLKRSGEARRYHSEWLEELEVLRQKRLKLERERIAAAEELMRLLGHL